MVSGLQAVAHHADQSHNLHLMLCATLVCGALAPVLGRLQILVKQREYLQGTRKDSQPGGTDTLCGWL